jgi:hypothetical protein
MHIQRPLVVTEKQQLYGDVFHSTQAHQHAYECVQPLQGIVTFDPADVGYRNNLSRDEPKASTGPPAKDWDTVIYCMIVAKFGFGAAMLYDVERQTTYNDIYLTYFKASANYSTYSVEGAGITNPLYCMLIAVSLAIFSVIIGLTSSKKYVLKMCESFGLALVLFLLQGLAIALHITMLLTQNQTVGAHCLTTLSMLVLHVYVFILSLVGFGLLLVAPKSPQSKEQTLDDVYRETTNNFYLCVVEDLNTILCYAFVVRACDAQSSIHDDSTTFFDVMCIVFVGFLQHIANILMIFHAHIEKHTHMEMKDKDQRTKTAMNDQHVELMNFIARTRVFLFFMIIATVVFFYLRVAPTYETFSTAATYVNFRSIAVIIMVALNTFHSSWYEIQNAYAVKTPWNTSPTWKLGALSLISLLVCITMWYHTTQDMSEGKRHLLHKLTVLATPAPKPAGTPSPPASK